MFVSWCEIQPGGVAMVDQHVTTGDTVQVVQAPLFNCVECGRAARWFVYLFDTPADADFSECSWVCDECKPAVMEQCLRNGWLEMPQCD